MAIDSTPHTRTSSRHVVVALCCATIIVDGFDLIVYGTVVPTMLDGSAEWTLTKAEAGRIGSYALFGMLIGAIVIGTITDLVGRRKIMLACIAWFSVAMAFAAMAPTPEMFGLARFVAGLGLGGVVPTAIALTIEYAHPRHRSLTNGIMFSGYSVGGILAALLAIWIIPELGWRTMFWVGAGLGGLVLLPLAAALLPESAGFLLARGRRAEAEALSARFNTTLEEPAAPATSDSKSGGLAALKALFVPRYLRGDRPVLAGHGPRTPAGLRVEHVAGTDHA